MFLRNGDQPRSPPTEHSEGIDEQPVGYAGRLLTPPERNYSRTKREALAMIWVINKFRGYLEETPTIVITNHQPLCWLKTLKSPTGG